MSKADEMFEELGYEKIVEHELLREHKDNTDITTEVIMYRDEITNIEISFWSDRTISKERIYDESYLTVTEIEAINQKCRELGWIGGEDE